MTSVSVLAPNGRRQNVKVTPNTTLLQVLEDVCKKQGLNPDEYDIKHFNKILDLSTVIRFSGLPNNTQLELVRAQKLRQETKVHIALQTGESTTRVTADFWPCDSLLHVVETLSSNELNAEDKTPVVIYMRKEMIGLNVLRTTQLKSLGLTKGSAVLRLVLRDNDLPPEQKTSGCAVYYKPPSGDEKTQNFLRQQQNSSVESKRSRQSKSEEAMDVTPSIPQTDVQHVIFSLPQTVPLELTQHSTKTQRENQNVREPGASTSSQNNQMEVSPVESIEEAIQYIGERNALIFNQADINSVPDQELPDEFFDLTVSDFRALARDYKRKLKDLEDNPLLTAAQRELKQSTQTLNRLNYKATVIRIQFPDRFVLQGVFTPVETVSHVMEFVRKFLQQPDLEFHLYMTPPKVILNPESYLVEVDCVPRALLYFGSVDEMNSTYLHSSYLSNLTTPRQASKAALLHVRKVNTVESESLEDSTESDERDKQNEAASAAVCYIPPSINRPSTSNDNQAKNVVPKWFKK